MTVSRFWSFRSWLEFAHIPEIAFGNLDLRATLSSMAAVQVVAWILLPAVVVVAGALNSTSTGEATRHGLGDVAFNVVAGGAVRLEMINLPQFRLQL